MGEELSLIWGVPFAGILLSIGLFPLFAPHFWHHHFPKVSLGWAALFAVPFLWVYRHTAFYEIAHIYLLDYVPFVILLWALFVVSGGILVRGTLVGTPWTNAMLMLIGTAIASWIGTTGASMLLIRPLLRANATRQHKVHTIVFFIFLVSNVGGSLTPLGDPPLFLGFLHNVPFFWTLEHMWPHLLTAAAILLAMYIVIDLFWYSRESAEAKVIPGEKQPISLHGKANFLLLLGIIAGVLLSGYWKPTFNAELGPIKIVDGGVYIMHGPEAHHDHAEEAAAASVTTGEAVAEAVPAPVIEVHEEKIVVESVPDAEHAAEGHHDLTVPVQNIARDGLLIFLGILSIWITSKDIREANGFSWFPIVEVAWLFAGIFMTIIPVLAILKAGEHGALSFIVASVQTPAQYFWVTGALSSFLDNAPTYLTFFNTALGRFSPGMPEAEAVAQLIAEQNNYLVAISVGSVFMGANTYIGNAPNFMVRSIAEEARIKMPNFFAYIFKYSLPILGTTFVIITYVFFRS